MKNNFCARSSSQSMGYFGKVLDKKGFSLVEILLVVATLSVLITGIFISYRSFEKKLQLNTTVNDVMAALQLAAERTVSSKNQEQYGVHFETNYYAIFSGYDWDAMDPENEVVYFPSGIEYTDIWGNPSDTILFDRITGTTPHLDDVILRLASDHNESRTIKVLPSGRVGLAGTINLADTRVTDSRHVHFDLGWSLQGASALELVFHDPPEADVTENIAMATYFDGGQTEFDWTGSVDVNGEIQTLRVHTHSLDAFDTILSIHRDGRYNTKALDISVDSKDIVSFTAGGVPTVGPFGGEMSVQ